MPDDAPKPWRSLLRRVARRVLVPSPGSVRMGHLRRLEPISRVYGFDRGQPIDRYYIAQFLEANASRVQGRVLEIGGRDYTQQYGGKKVTRSDVLNVKAGDSQTTFVADLTDGAGVPDDAFDCVILTQTLHLIFDVNSAIKTLYRVLKPGGTLLMTVPGTISQIEQGVWRSVWYWGFTQLSLDRLFTAVFPRDAFEIQEHGNVLASIAFLEGLAAEEFTPAELAHRDELYPLLLTLRATKPL